VSYKEWIEISIRHNVYVLHSPPWNVALNVYQTSCLEIMELDLVFDRYMQVYMQVLPSL